MRIGTIEVNNFLSFTEAHLELASGLFLVVGINEESDKTGNSSNGSGKSALMVEAPTWLFFDKTARGIKADDVIKKGTKHCSVKSIIYDSRGKKYFIERERNKGKGSVLTINKKPSSQEELEGLLGLDFNTFTTAVVHPQDFQGFADKKDKERKEILTKILGLERFDVYKSKIKEFADSNIKDIEKVVSRLSTNTTMLEKFKGQKESLKEDYEMFESEREEKIIEYKERIDAIAEKTKLLKQKEKEVSGLKDEKQKFEKELKLVIKDEQNISLRYDEVKQELDNKKFQIRNLGDKYEMFKKEIKALKSIHGGKCPTCHQLVKGEQADICIKKWEEELKNITVDEESCEKEIKKMKEQFELSNRQFEDIKEKIKVTSQNYHITVGKFKGMDLENEKNLINQNLNLCKKSLKEWGNKENPCIKMEKNIEVEIKNLIKEIEFFTKDVKDLQQLQPYYDFWVEGFGNAGMKSFIFDTIVPEFTMRANRYVQELSNGNITVEFDTQTEKKSGGFSEKFSINITDGVGSRPYEAWSGGEKKRISIAIDFALSDLIASKALKQWDYAAFDEILDGLDFSGKSTVINLLESMQREEGKFIYIISHDVELLNIFDKKIIVKKSGGESSLAEA